MSRASGRVEENILWREEEGWVPVGKEEEDVLEGMEEEDEVFLREDEVSGREEEVPNSLLLWLALSARQWQTSERWCLS